MGHDRDEVLARTDLSELCDDLLGPHKGHGKTLSWRCPEPNHGPQTGATPPVTVFNSRGGTERWHCHGCGAGGTAIDLVMRTQGIGFREALDVLGRLAGAPETEPVPPRHLRAVPDPRIPAAEPSPALEAYVSGCEEWLWGPGGAVMRRWLAGRGLGEEVLRANRVGADPGPAALPRQQGLPRGGVAVVFPLLDDSGRPHYAQARYLRPRGHKYDNPSSDLVPASPRFGEMRGPRTAVDEGVVLVCEGIPDALSAAQSGFRAVAVLGAGLPDERLARALAERYPAERLVIAFDADHRGRSGAERLADLLSDVAGQSRVGTISVPGEFGDLNGWAQAGRERFGAELAGAVAAADPGVGTSPARGPDTTEQGLDVDDLVETLAYRHLLVDDADEAELARSEVADALSAWRSGAYPLAGRDKVEPQGVGEMLEQVAYHGLLSDDDGAVATTVDRVEAALETCAAPELGLDDNDRALGL